MYSYASKSNWTFSGSVREAHDSHLDAVSVNEDHGDADDSRRLDVEALVVLVQQAVELSQQASHDEVAVDEHCSGAGQHHVQEHRHRGEVAPVFYRHVDTTHRHDQLQSS